MERDAAKLVILEAFRSMGHLTDLLPFLKQAGPAEDYDRLAKGIARATAEIGLNVLEPMFEMHPDLRAEADRRIEETGRFY